MRGTNLKPLVFSTQRETIIFEKNILHSMEKTEELSVPGDSVEVATFYKQAAEIAAHKNFHTW